MLARISAPEPDPIAPDPGPFPIDVVMDWIYRAAMREFTLMAQGLPAEQPEIRAVCCGNATHAQFKMPELARVEAWNKAEPPAP
jgi:hypothetical protein